jgi:hypothetical protein
MVLLGDFFLFFYIYYLFAAEMEYEEIHGEEITDILTLLSHNV